MNFANFGYFLITLGNFHQGVVENSANFIRAIFSLFYNISNHRQSRFNIFDDNLATTWESWKKSWTRYEIATGVQKKEDIVTASTLISVIGEDGVKAYDTFSWAKSGIKTMLMLYLKSLMNLFIENANNL